MRTPLSGCIGLDPELAAKAARALEYRRAVGAAGEIPGYWLLDSPSLTEVTDLARRLSLSPGVPVLIQGERGTGVPELARLIHDADPIARTGHWRTMGGPIVNPPDMRAWTPDGTLFIEDLENLRPAAQAWLEDLLASQTQLGRRQRIIAGSRLSAAELFRHPNLREELVHALDVGRLVLPPLRERPSDIMQLAHRFLWHYAAWQGRPLLRFTESAERKLLTYSYPANVRELRNLVERAAALATSDEVGEDVIVAFEQADPTSVRTEPLRAISAADKDKVAKMPTLAELERDYLVRLIGEFRGRRAAISRALGVSYPTVRRMIADHRLDVKAIVDAATFSTEAAV